MRPFLGFNPALFELRDITPGYSMAGLRPSLMVGTFGAVKFNADQEICAPGVVLFLLRLLLPLPGFRPEPSVRDHPGLYPAAPSAFSTRIRDQLLPSSGSVNLEANQETGVPHKDVHPAGRLHGPCHPEFATGRPEAWQDTAQGEGEAKPKTEPWGERNPIHQ